MKRKEKKKLTKVQHKPSPSARGGVGWQAKMKGVGVVGSNGEHATLEWRSITNSTPCALRIIFLQRQKPQAGGE